MLPAAQFGFIVENIGAGEIVVIAFLALVILGPDRIPEMARGAGRLLHNAKKFTSNLSGDMADVINDPAMQPIKELGEFAARPRQKITEYALEAEAEERQKAAAEQTSARAEANGSPDKPASSPDDPASSSGKAASAGDEADSSARASSETTVEPIGDTDAESTTEPADQVDPAGDPAE